MKKSWQRQLTSALLTAFVASAVAWALSTSYVVYSALTPNRQITNFPKNIPKWQVNNADPARVRFNQLKDKIIKKSDLRMKYSVPMRELWTRRDLDEAVLAKTRPARQAIISDLGAISAYKALDVIPPETYQAIAKILETEDNFWKTTEAVVEALQKLGFRDKETQRVIDVWLKSEGEHWNSKLILANMEIEIANINLAEDERQLEELYRAKNSIPRIVDEEMKELRSKTLNCALSWLLVFVLIITSAVSSKSKKERNTLPEDKASPPPHAKTGGPNTASKTP
jgi:hypothetical protein